MRRAVTAVGGVVLAAFVFAILGSGSALAMDEIITVTGQVVVVEEDASGDMIVKIVTETDEFLVHEQSKASDVSAQAGKTVTATGTVEVTEVAKTISVDEYALVEINQPPIGAP